MSSIIVANIEPEHKSCKKEDVTRRWPRCICTSEGSRLPYHGAVYRDARRGGAPTEFYRYEIKVCPMRAGLFVLRR